MIPIHYPEYPYRIKTIHDKEWIFDEWRKKWLVLTPEEWVRQNFLQWLIHIKKYPASLIAIEKEIRLGELKKRCDIVVYRDSLPWMIIECKEMNVPLNDATLRQILNYNISLRVQYLIVTNGTNTFAFELDGASMKALPEIPDF